MRRLFIALTVILTVGCVSQEGLFPSGSDWGVEELIEKRELHDEATDSTSRDVEKDLVIIGTTSAFRPLTISNFGEIYADYLEFAERLHPAEPAEYSEEEFRRAVAGWTKLKVFTIPLVMGGYDYALVPEEIHAKIRFPSSFGTFMIQEAGDLVVARTNTDGYFFVRQVLCRDGKGYFSCAKAHHKGLFDGATGRELDSKKLVPKEHGKRINLVDYKKGAP